MEQRKTFAGDPPKVGDRVELIITTTYDKNGEIAKDKDGNNKIKLRAPKEDDWTLVKKRTEHLLNQNGRSVGSFIYFNLLHDPSVKIKGKLISTIERDLYKKELEKILKKQKEFHPELSNKNLYEQCANELYHNNEAHVASLMRDIDFTKLFIDDIIFYQRPLKSKKSEISDCQYECRHYTDPKTGERVTVPLKCVPKSHPLYQEFRLWQWISNLKIWKRGLHSDTDVTGTYLSDAETIETLFCWLSERKDIGQDQLLKFLKLKAKDYRWNYPEDKTYPCGETLYAINSRLDKIGAAHLSDDDVYHLWHIEISVTDPRQNKKALVKFATNHGIDPEAFVAQFKNYVPDSSTYGAFSEKALKRMLPLMRQGSRWSAEAIDATTRERINHLIDGEADDSISERVREMASKHGLDAVEKFCGLNTWQAGYIVYNRLSETADLSRWEKPEDIDAYITTKLPHNSLRNPVVEKVVVETLKVIKDIWKAHGKIDEVHIEMGRDLKNHADKRKAASERNAENERTNMRIRFLLQELADPKYGIEGVRPKSPMQMELLKIYEEEAVGNSKSDADIAAIMKKMSTAANHAEVKESDVRKFMMWLEQGCRSPYTGNTIKLSRLFTHDYEIEHVIPQSRYFDDSLSNKVICESDVNRLKGNRLAYEFILQEGGRKIDGHTAILDKDQYEQFIAEHYKTNPRKRQKLLMDDIPEGFIQRQLNDSRYMSRKMQEILSLLVRDNDEQEATSKNVVSTNGSITDRLKNDWGLNDVWNDMMTPRFERLNSMTRPEQYGSWQVKDGKRFFRTDVPLEQRANFSKKRIDHRHHAMDAIVIAFTTRNHINFLNNSNAAKDKEKERFDLRKQLCSKKNTDTDGNYKWLFNKPYDNFTQDARIVLENMTVSFKQNLRILTKTTNFYTHYENGKKVVSKQTKGDGWAVRKSLHKATVHGVVSLQQRKSMKLSMALEHWHNICDREVRAEIKKVVNDYYGKVDVKTLNKYFKDREYKAAGKDIRMVDVWTYTSGKDALSATRVALDGSFKSETIDKITDSGIRAILHRHLDLYNDTKGKSHPELAFSPEGIAVMNANIKQLNNGRDHKPIYKVRKTESLGAKFRVGQTGSKKRKFVEADKGTNLFFAIYADEKGERYFSSIPLNVVVERLKQGLAPAPDRDENGNRLLFSLSPGDLVYVPTEEEHVSTPLNPERIYKMVSCGNGQCFFVPASWATVIANGLELESQNKMEKTIDGVFIKKCCVKLSVDRLGRITKIITGE